MRRAQVLQGIRRSGADAGAEYEEGTGPAGDQQIRRKIRSMSIR